jgi:hypothetical protein
LSTTNLTWIDQGANPGLRGERPATNDLSHGTAPNIHIIILIVLYVGEGEVTIRSVVAGQIVTEYIQKGNFVPGPVYCSVKVYRGMEMKIHSFEFWTLD